MKLQAALDCSSIEQALELMEKIHPYVDIIEIGSYLGLVEGFSALGKMKKAHPDKLILSDAKIVDGGYDIAAAALDAGADIVTTIGMTNNETCRGVVRAAHERGKYAMVDTIGVSNLAQRVRELDEMGFDYILVHTAYDMLDCISAPIEALKVIKANVRNAKAGISGGITPDQMEEIAAAQPDWIVVGSAIYKAKDPLKVVQEFNKYLG